MKKKPNYASFTINDFICDEYFQDWILHPDEENEAFWNSWMSENPRQKETIKRAKDLLSDIRFKEHFPDDERVRKALAENLRMLDKASMPQQAEVRRMRFKNWVAAAVFIGVLILGYGSFNFWRNHARITVSTAYGEIKTIHLPDSSLITLNAHSTLSYPRYWNSKRIRQVWLNGEAFFEVKHLNKNIAHIVAGEHFIVHTKSLNVAVLGTSFDVNVNAGITKVMLKTGSVEIKFNKANQENIRLKPGDLVAYNAPENKLIKTTTDADVYIAWIDRKLILNGASVKEIAQYLHQFYGYTIIMKDPSIENKSMEGILELDTLPNILFVMSTALNIKIVQQGDTLIFEKNRE
ncbi:MAG: DUF4974 domain-containing protein [Chitinophagaceae bacterium]|nr:MAG: DUF4974 domain-containing protein [Chitinophagaceae bacterium]